MEIGGPLQPLTTTGADPYRQRPGQSPDSSAQNNERSLPPRSRQIIRTDTIDIEAAYQSRKRRFQTRDIELPYQALQAIGTYKEADYAAGPELLHRLDVYV